MRRVAIMACALAAAITGVPGAGVSQMAAPFPSGVAAGDIAPTSALLWTRLDRVQPVVVDVARDPGFAAMVYSARAAARTERGGVATARAEGLAPHTRYYYRFRVERGGVSESGTFVTAPPAEAAADLRLAFSGDADGTHVGGAPVYPHEVFRAAAGERPDLFVFLGDTIYSDSSHSPHRASTLDEYRAKYRESRSIPSVRAALRAAAVEVMWDDHEVANDFDPQSVAPAKYAAGRRAFLEAWPTGAARGRLYRSMRWGREVEIFILDLRSYRSPQIDKTSLCHNPPGGQTADMAPTLPSSVRAAFAPLARSLALPIPPGCLEGLRDPARTLLGSDQKAWLKQQLRRSRATWKLVFTPDPIQEIFGFPYDRWEGYAAERVEMLNFIRLGNIKNVIWLSADAHAVLANDVRVATFGAPAATGMREVVVGPIAARTFGDRIARQLGAPAVPVFGAFLQAPPPQGLGMACAVLDQLTYAMVEVRGASRTVTITPKDAAGRPVCRAPVVLSSTP